MTLSWLAQAAPHGRATFWFLDVNLHDAQVS